MGDLEVLARLKEIRPDVPVIVISAVDTAAMATRAMKLGAFDYVTKPYDDTALIRLVSSAVRAPCSGPDRPGRPAAPTWASHGLLLAGHDVPLLAMLKLAVRADCATALASTPASALRHLDRFRPVVSLIDDSLNWRDVIGLARAVRRACDDAAIVIGCGPAVPPALLDELSPFDPRRSSPSRTTSMTSSSACGPFFPPNAGSRSAGGGCARARRRRGRPGRSPPSGRATLDPRDENGIHS